MSKKKKKRKHKQPPKPPTPAPSPVTVYAGRRGNIIIADVRREEPDVRKLAAAILSMVRRQQVEEAASSSPSAAAPLPGDASTEPTHGETTQTEPPSPADSSRPDTP